MDQTLRFLQQENTRLQEQVRHLEDELAIFKDYLSALIRLDQAASQIGIESELYPLLEKILYYALTTLDAVDGSIALVDDETDELVFVIVMGGIGTQLVNQRMSKEEGIIGWVVAHGEPALVNDVSKDVRFSPRNDNLFDFVTRSMVCVPLKLGSRMLGAITVLNKHSGEDFQEIDQCLLSLIARIAADALDRMDDET